MGLLRVPLPFRHWSAWVRYGLTIALFGLAAVAHAAWQEATAYPSLIFLAYVFICAFFLCRGPALLATALSASTLAYSLLNPGAPEIVLRRPDLVALAIFVLVALGTTELISVLHERNAALAVSEQEKDLLLRESAHRTKNDLSRLVALIELERRATAEPPFKARLGAISDRLRVFARLQSRLIRVQSQAVVDMQQYLADLCQDVQRSLAQLRPITVSAKSDRRLVPEATAGIIGLIANELVTNALKHAFPGNRPGHVQVTFRAQGDRCALWVEDDGVGISTPPEPVSASASLGQKLVVSLANQLQGEAEIRNRSHGKGAIACVRFPSLD